MEKNPTTSPVNVLKWVSNKRCYEPKASGDQRSPLRYMSTTAAKVSLSRAYPRASIQLAIFRLENQFDQQEFALLVSKYINQQAFVLLESLKKIKCFEVQRFRLIIAWQLADTACNTLILCCYSTRNQDQSRQYTVKWSSMRFKHGSEMNGYTLGGCVQSRQDAILVFVKCYCLTIWNVLPLCIHIFLENCLRFVLRNCFNSLISKFRK